MAVNSFLSNQGTQSSLLTDNTGGAGGTLIPVMKISTDGQGTFTNAGIWNGNVGISSGTINISTISSLPNIPGGTLGVVQAGTINSATVTGNLGTIGTIGLATVAGNLGTLGTVGLATTQMSSGTVNVGTVNTGTVYKGILAGQAGSLTAAGTITAAGSQLDLSYWDIGGTWVGTLSFQAQIGTSAWFPMNIISSTGGNIGTQVTGNGDYMQSMSGVDNIRAVLTYSSGTLTYNQRSSNFFSPMNYVLGGTIANVGMVNAGTINNATVNTGTVNTGTVNTGTINVATITAGTINAGTFREDARTTQNIVSFGTQVAFTGAAAATIVGSASVGAGTYLWVNDVSLFNLQSGAGTFILGFGTTQQGTNVLLRAPIGTSSAVGIEKPYPKPVNAGMTNQDLVLSATGAGTVELSISYFIST